MKWVLSSIIMMLSFTAIANIESSADSTSQFNASKFIFEHVSDSHEWHFFSIGETHVSIPLPVILYSKVSGINIFLSSKLNHAQEAGFNFKYDEDEASVGKIIEVMPDGQTSTPLDFSITKTVLGLIITALLLLVILIKVGKQISKDPMAVPHGKQTVVEVIVVFVRDDIAKSFINKNSERYLPFLLTTFCFILVANLIGMISPLGLNITGNIAVTMVLALFTFAITTFSSNKNYWKEIFNPNVPLFLKLPIPLMPFIEILGVFIKPLILMVRLFANMFSGHMTIAVLVSLIFLMGNLFGTFAGIGTSIISVVFSIFMMMIDLLVAFIQAYIFTLLSALYFGMATAEEH